MIAVSLAGKMVACVAGGISRASAFVLVTSGEAVRGLVKSRVEEVGEESSRALSARKYGGSAAARPLTHPASYAG